MNRLVSAVLLLCIASCGNSLPIDQAGAPLSDIDGSQLAPGETADEWPVDGVWLLVSTEDPGQSWHLLGEPFRVGSWIFTLSIEHGFASCVSPVDGRDVDGGMASGLRSAHSSRPITVLDNLLVMRFTMDFHPTWYDVFDELLDEDLVEVRITGTPVRQSSDRAVVFDVTVERLFVASGHMLLGTGTLTHIPFDPWFDCE